ncbi:hypothetical protein MVEN_02389400 [Mycena venus]|uniref:Uncharacterized protein n=1 Tax=Mycena venus TaxID=2733690 RepID=A0A8H7CD59_9AGAR|nr:hypothetical protein MVEN_02389400 [Mycena venus]
MTDLPLIHRVLVDHNEEGVACITSNKVIMPQTAKQAESGRRLTACPRLTPMPAPDEPVRNLKLILALFPTSART